VPPPLCLQPGLLAAPCLVLCLALAGRLAVWRFVHASQQHLSLAALCCLRLLITCTANLKPVSLTSLLTTCHQLGAGLRACLNAEVRRAHPPTAPPAGTCPLAVPIGHARQLLAPALNPPMPLPPTVGMRHTPTPVLAPAPALAPAPVPTVADPIPHIPHPSCRHCSWPPCRCSCPYL